MVGSDISDQQACQRSDSDVNEKAHRHVVGLEIYAYHGAKFEVDEQQQDVIN